MKKKIIISINPEHVKNIISGTKKYEYRTKAAKHDINKIIIYETKPVRKIVAEAEVIDVLMMAPEDLWKETKSESGISKKHFDNYFKSREFGYAYKLGKIKVYEKPKSLNEFGLKFAPQSFVYVN
ncbi:MAG TPA: ASCH domain-containing protein [Erysipelotrichaceae bacterium]|nr:ASCH domain-containing protein [Erysipelotrichaceae bacterium]